MSRSALPSYTYRATIWGEKGTNSAGTISSVSESSQFKHYTVAHNRRNPLWYPRITWPAEVVIPQKGPLNPENRASAMKPWGNTEGWRGTRWMTHTDDTLGLIRDVAAEEMLWDSDLEAFAGITLRGQTDEVGDLQGSFIVHEQYPVPYTAGHNEWVPPGWQLVEGSFTNIMLYKKNFERSLYKRRFWTMRFHFGKGDWQHWATGVLDRKNSTLFYIDTIFQGRKERMIGAGLIFRTFLAAIDMPYTFTIISLGYTAQPQGWECGLLSQFIIHQLIKCPIGKPLSQVNMQFVQVEKAWDKSCIEPNGYQRCELLFQDWAVLGGQKAKKAQATEALQRVRGLVVAMGCNEIGARKAQWKNGKPLIPQFSLGNMGATNWTINVPVSSVLGTVVPLSVWNEPRVDEVNLNIWQTSPGLAMHNGWAAIPIQMVHGEIRISNRAAPKNIERLKGIIPSADIARPTDSTRDLAGALTFNDPRKIQNKAAATLASLKGQPSNQIVIPPTPSKQLAHNISTISLIQGSRDNSPVVSSPGSPLSPVPDRLETPERFKDAASLAKHGVRSPLISQQKKRLRESVSMQQLEHTSPGGESPLFIESSQSPSQSLRYPRHGSHNPQETGPGNTVMRSEDRLYTRRAIAGSTIGDLEVIHTSVNSIQRYRRGFDWASDRIGPLTRLMVGQPAQTFLGNIYNPRGFFYIAHPSNHAVRNTFVSVMPYGMVNPWQWADLHRAIKEHNRPPVSAPRQRQDGRPQRQTRPPQ